MRSSKRTPSASSTSACARHDWPDTGRCARPVRAPADGGNRWRRCRSPTRRPECAAAPRARSRSAVAPPYLTPWPTRMTGRSAASSMSTRLGDAFRIGAAARRDVGVPVFRLRRFLGRGFLEDVERHIEHDRAGPPGHHGLPRLPDRQRHHVAARRLEHALAIGAHGGGKIGLVVPVELLKRAAIELAGRHVAGHRQERHRIEKGVGEAIGRLAEPGPQDVKVAVGCPPTR